MAAVVELDLTGSYCQESVLQDKEDQKVYTSRVDSRWWTLQYLSQYSREAKSGGSESPLGLKRRVESREAKKGVMTEKRVRYVKKGVLSVDEARFLGDDILVSRFVEVRILHG